MFFRNSLLIKLASSQENVHIGSNPLGSRRTKLLILNTKTEEVSSNGFNQIRYLKNIAILPVLTEADFMAKCFVTKFTGIGSFAIMRSSSMHF